MKKIRDPLKNIAVKKFKVIGIGLQSKATRMQPNTLFQMPS